MSVGVGHEHPALVGSIGHNSGQFQDRPYQTEAVGSIWTYFQTHLAGNPLVAMPTGSGKSLVIARFLQSVFGPYPNQRVLILTHVKELIQQNYEKLMTVWPFAPAGIYSAGLGIKEHRQPITFAGIQSVWKIPALFGKVDLILIDEAHLLSPNDTTMYRKFLSALLGINPCLRIIGFTATPWRLGHGHLTDPSIVRKQWTDPISKKTQMVDAEEPSLFTDVCFDITGVEAFNRLIAEGYLVPLISKRTQSVLDVEGLHMRGGEFIEGEMQEAFDNDKLNTAIIREAMELGHNRHKWLVFASGTDHADHLYELLNDFGIPAGCVHSKRGGRDETMKQFKYGDLRAVVNNNVLTTGVDVPAIDFIVGARATASSVLWGQILGRGTRPLWTPGFNLNDIGGRLASIMASQKHNCLVADYARNTKRLGPINDPVTPKRKGMKAGKAPVKECPACECDVHASLRFCNTPVLQPDGTEKACGHEFIFETKLSEKAGTDEIIKGDMPIVEVFKVDHITVTQHEKHGSPPMMKVSYYCGLQKFDEFIHFERQDFTLRKARQWWNLRSVDPMPASTAEAVESATRLKPATHLRVWINKKYPEILAFCFDGTAFGTVEADPFLTPFIETDAPRKSPTSDSRTAFEYDDEIPF